MAKQKNAKLVAAVKKVEEEPEEKVNAMRKAKRVDDDVD